MIRSNLSTALDPLAHRAAINALEAQRAAYRRFAREVEAQNQTLTDGDGDRAMAVGADVFRSFSELQEGVRTLEPLVQDVWDSGSGDQLVEVQRQMDDLMREARLAETAIQNMTVQLEAWRDAYGRQLAELGLVPGGAGEGAWEPEGAPMAGSGYGPRGAGPAAPSGRGPSLIDRKG